jgi:hypothetical protein
VSGETAALLRPAMDSMSPKSQVRKGGERNWGEKGPHSFKVDSLIVKLWDTGTST